MVPPDHDRRRHLARPDELVERQPGPRPLAVAEPADPRRQSLERDALLGERDPACERRVAGEQLEDRAIGPQDVVRVAGERGPPERAAALAELGPDEGRHEARVVERVVDAGVLRHRAQVVAVVEHDRAGSLELEHRPDVGGHRGGRAADVLVGLVLAQRGGIVERDLRRHVADERVVGGRLVRDDVEPLAGLRPAGLDLRGVADEGDRDVPCRPAAASRAIESASSGESVSRRRSRCRGVASPAPGRPRSRGRRPRSS